MLAEHCGTAATSVQASFPGIDRVACDRCFDLGIYIGPSSNAFEPCPNIVLGREHAEPSPVAQIVQDAVMRQKIPADSHLFEIVRTLAMYTTDDPCPGNVLIDRHFAFSNGSSETKRRQVSAAIERLRVDWVLPVGSRKDQPSGYWIMTDQVDFEIVLDEWLAQPKKTIGMAYRLAKRYFPVFAGQLELSLQDIEADALVDQILEGE